MFSLFVVEKDSNGIEHIRRKGRNLSDAFAAGVALGKYKKAFLMDTGVDNPTGLSKFQSFLNLGYRVCAAKGMPEVQRMLT